jgi:hypothetical protein
MSALDVQSDTQVRPSSHLIRDGRLLSKLFLILLIFTLLTDAAAVAAMELRLHVAGMLHGGFSFLVNIPWLDKDTSVPAAFTPIVRYAVWKSSLAGMLLALRLTPALVILWNLYRLFDMYGRGEVFTFRNEFYLRSIAWSLLGYATVPLVTHATLYLIGMSDVALKLEGRQFDAMAAALILLAVSRVVSFGCAIEEDREGII